MKSRSTLMNRHGFRTLFLLAIAVFAIPARAAAQVTDWRQINIPPLKAFQPKQPKRIELPNGMVIFLQEDHELPLIDGVARIRGGSRSEPASKTGLTELYGEVWRTGGTKAQTGDDLDDFLEVRAAKVETGGGADSTTVAWSCLKGDFDDVFKVFLDVLRNPEFRDDKLDLAQKEAFDGISRRNDDAGGIAARESVKLAYGAQNPYARVEEYATIGAITRQDLIDFHKHHVQPNNIILGVAGDFDSAAMAAKLRQAFGDWPKGAPFKKEEIEFKPGKAGYYQVAKDDVNQSSIEMLALGTTRRDKDYYAIQVFDEAFGGGFASRLFRNIRTNLGLAYAVGGGVGTAYDHPGILRLSMGTKSATTAEAIQALYQQIDDLAKNPISEDEMKKAKDSILNSFVFNFDSPDKVLREKMAYEFYGYPSDFLEQYRAGIEKVGTADVARVAAKYLHKDRMSVLVVGNTTEFDKPLSSFGPVTNIDISIPPPPGAPAGGNGSESGKHAAGSPSASAAPPSGAHASNAEGKMLAAKVAEAMGGEAKLKSIKTMSVDFNLTSPQQPGLVTLHTELAFPDHMRAELHPPEGGGMTIIVSGHGAFVISPTNTVNDMPAPQSKEMLDQIHRDLVYIGQHVSDPGFTFTAGASKKIGDAETRELRVSGSGMSITWFVDPSNGHILSETYQSIGPSGPVEGQTDLSDWKTVDGLTLPFNHVNRRGGEDAGTTLITTIQLNPSLDMKRFEKPVAENAAAH